MTTFVLILTMIISGPAVSVTSVPGFESDAACQAAGQMWLGHQIDKSAVKANFVCVGQTKK
jgi:hypothetical protein